MNKLYIHTLKSSKLNDCTLSAKNHDFYQYNFKVFPLLKMKFHKKDNKDNKKSKNGNQNPLHLAKNFSENLKENKNKCNTNTTNKYSNQGEVYIDKKLVSVYDLISVKAKNDKLILAQIENFIMNSTTNKYNGLEIDIDKLFSIVNYKREDNNFDIVLKELLIFYTEKVPKSSITIVIPKSKIYLAEFFINENFYMHNCNKNNLTLCKWLRKDCDDKIPKYPHTMIGTGSVILTKENRVILIKEKFSNYNVIKWKFVTGLNDVYESVHETCKRESKEETNLKIDYHGVIAISECFPSIYNGNDICFFNLCSINASADEIRKQVILDYNEVDKIEFFAIKDLKELIKLKDITLFSQKILEKLFDALDDHKSLEENIQYIIENNIILKPNNHEKEFDYNFKSMKLYL